MVTVKNLVHISQLGQQEQIISNSDYNIRGCHWTWQWKGRKELMKETHRSCARVLVPAYRHVWYTSNHT